VIYTGSARYAVRAMIFLAAGDSKGRPRSAAEVASAEDIPPYYLAKVLQNLGKAGLLGSARGRGGGFYLARPADEIRIVEVLEAVENVGRLDSECLLGLDECAEDSPCPLHDPWSEFRTGVMEALRTLTIAELVTELERKRAAAARVAKDS